MQENKTLMNKYMNEWAIMVTGKQSDEHRYERRQPKTIPSRGELIAYLYLDTVYRGRNDLTLEPAVIDDSAAMTKCER